MDQFNRGLAANNKETMLRYWTAPSPTKTWETPCCLAKSLTFLLTPKVKATRTTTITLWGFLVQYSSSIINLYFKVIQVLVLFCEGNYLQGTRTAYKLYFIPATHLAIYPLQSGFILFLRGLVLCEMLSVSSRIWTRIAVSISYNDNHYPTGTSINSHKIWLQEYECVCGGVECKERNRKRKSEKERESIFNSYADPRNYQSTANWTENYF